MKDLLLYIVTQLVDDPSQVEVQEESLGEGNVRLTLKVAATDMGKVIGKSGKTIRSIRDVVKIKAVKENKFVDVVLAE